MIRQGLFRRVPGKTEVWLPHDHSYAAKLLNLRDQYRAARLLAKPGILSVRSTRLLEQCGDIKTVTEVLHQRVIEICNYVLPKIDHSNRVSIKLMPSTGGYCLDHEVALVMVVDIGHYRDVPERLLYYGLGDQVILRTRSFNDDQAWTTLELTLKGTDQPLYHWLESEFVMQRMNGNISHYLSVL